MTITEIMIEVADYKPLSADTLRKHLRTLKIKPLGVRQCPQRYPDDSAERVLKHMGFKVKKKVQRHGRNLLAA